MRGQKHELHAADEIGAGHHHKRGVAERGPHCRHRGGIADVVGSGLRQRNGVDAAGVPGGGNHQHRHHDEAGKPHAPAEPLAENLPDRRRQQRTERTRAGDDAKHGGADRLRNRASRNRHGDCGRGAGKRGADQDTAADHDADEPVRGRHQGEAHDVHQRTHDHDRAEAVAHRQRTGQRLQEAPGEVLHGQRQGEVRHRDADVVRQRLQEDAQALAQAHAERQHQRGADQDGQCGSQDLQEGHCSCSPLGARRGHRRLRFPAI